MPDERSSSSYNRAKLEHALADRYLIDRELGRGGMATVYLAQDLRHDRLVALKVLHADVAESVGAERFLTEIKTAARLNHPHILPLFDSGQADEFLYYVMPYVEGESLRQRLDREHQIPVADAIQYLREMSAALDYSHRQGVVHRDIKPENVMVHEGIAMLMDFGIAKAMDSASSGLTGTGMFVGTPAYISPEQAFGEGTIDGRSDQFSLACVLHEMISGEQPFTGSSQQAIIAKRLGGVAPVLDGVWESVGDELKASMLRGMSLEPESRFPTMRDFALAVSRSGNGLTSGPTFVVPAVSAAKSIAVLPFANVSTDKENEYLADGLAEEIINSLSRVRTLRVASRSLSFAVKGRDNDLIEVGRKLKVSTILTGSVRRSGNRIRVSAELVNAADGLELWSERYDREMEDVFAIQDDIAESIVRALRVVLGEGERQAIKARIRNVKAYELYLRGRQYFGFNRRGLDYALEMFEQAVAIDPEFAAAYSGIADALSFIWLIHERSDEVRNRADDASRLAVEMEPSLAEAHHSRGMARSLFADYEVSDSEMAIAMKLDPKLADVPMNWALTHRMRGNFREALNLALLAQALRPEDYDIAGRVSSTYDALGRNAESKAARKRALDLVEDRVKLNPDDTRALVLCGVSNAKAGNVARAKEVTERALAMGADDPMIHYNAACTYITLGEIERALDELEMTIRLGYRNVDWLDTDEDLIPVRDLERYKEIRASVK
jgi:serine/threonine protein kinase/tetratricopeptide (TPR) repeat protein